MSLEIKDTLSCKKNQNPLLLIYRMKCRMPNTQVVIHLAFCLNVAQDHMKGAPSETRTHSRRVASRAC